MGTTSDKLTYLNETKTLLKNKINITGANITTDTFRQYPTKLQNALLECWNNEGEPIFTNWGTKVTGEGTNVKLDNTINARMKITPKGNTSQIQYSGKNLFDKDTMVLNAYINTTGWALNSNASLRTAYIPCQSNTIYTISKIQSARFAVASYSSLEFGTIGENGYADNSATKLTITTSANAKYLCVFYYHTSDTLSEETIRNSIQFEKGSTATTYEPYVGGIPSPNPSYPQNINVVSGDNEVVVCGKNIFDGEIELGGIDPANGSLVSNNARTRSKNYTKVKPNTTYTFKREVGENRWIVGYTSSKVGITDGNFNNKASAIRSIGVNDNIMIFTTTSTTEYIKWYDTNSTDLTEKVMIELGSTATTYEPYISQSYNVNLGTIELCKIGTYQDYIYKDSGKWYLHKEVGKATPTITASSITGLYMDNTTWSGKYASQEAYCRYFKNIVNTNITDNSTADTYLSDNQFSFRWGNDSAKDRLYIKSSSSLAQIQALGVEIYYVMKTPTNIEITNTTLINQLENLRGAMSYEGQTNIDGGFMIVGASALGELS